MFASKNERNDKKIRNLTNNITMEQQWPGSKCIESIEFKDKKLPNRREITEK